MDTLWFKAGIYGVVTPQIAVPEIRTNPPHVTAAVGRSTATVNGMSVERPTVPVAAPRRMTPWGFSFKYPLRSLWPGGGNRNDAIALDDAVSVVDEKEQGGSCVGEEEAAAADAVEGQNGNWVLNILRTNSEKGEVEALRAKEEDEEEEEEDGSVDDHRSECSISDDGDRDEECDDCKIRDDGDKFGFDRESFSRLLRRVSLADARLYSRMSYLGNLAYAIPQIKPGNLLKHHGLRFVTSSIEKRELAVKVEKVEVQDEEVKEADKVEVEDEVKEAEEVKVQAEAKEVEETIEENKGIHLSPYAAYQVAATAASFLHSRTKSILPFTSTQSEASKELNEGHSDDIHIMGNEVASFMATTDSVTAVVAAKEEVKQAVADDLNKVSSSPCEWFACDDNFSSTRFFVIQGSESLASWQANLLFEPVQFEGFDVLVHRGIYEAAKGIYEQMLPEVRAHLKYHGDRATFRFTGHSLGGSLSLLVNLMLLIRGQVPPSSLLPVITFGAPSIMCGGDRLLEELGLPRNHLQAIMMHRDIVPRAFSCHYPSHVAELLKAVNKNFRNHPCLNNQRLLYGPMGDFLILQPDDKFSPNHELLPSGSGLYLLTCPASDFSEEEEDRIRAARSVFLNSPHPLEILSDRSAYGSEGSIQRDHDMSSYLKSVRSVVRQDQRRIRRERRDRRRKVWWHLLAPGGIAAGIFVGKAAVTSNLGINQVNFSGIFQNGKESIKRFSRLVASQHMHLFVVLLIPARSVLLESLSAISFR